MSDFGIVPINETYRVYMASKFEERIDDYLNINKESEMLDTQNKSWSYFIEFKDPRQLDHSYLQGFDEDYLQYKIDSILLSYFNNLHNDSCSGFNFEFELLCYLNLGMMIYHSQKLILN